MGLIKGYKEEIVEWVAGMSPDELDSLVQHYREKSTETSMGFSNPKHLTEEQRTLLISLRPSLKESTRFVSGLTYMTRGGAVRSCILFPTLHATDSAGFDRGVLFDDAVLVLDNPDYRKFASLAFGSCQDPLFDRLT
ncbi:hypothetical protein [Candidatus Magnetobacterium casense]|uniref:Uncharacterized protein n=1 Tax=Candidatus Magnetobacterium casense TaxID=1455061 RepID=A0ABS6S271_9BACT|nr:hypothetical protein [Candidatus Magnetobacterium casensis]MBV6342945.1 hypothetical protein [Candidatus Magnetobacterium casensis]